MNNTKTPTIAYFISPHGYGHAARSAAVMEALRELDPKIRFEIFTTIPYGFFQDTLGGRFGYHTIKTDVGFVQNSPLHVDLSETLKELDRFFPIDHSRTAHVTDLVRKMKCLLILCDISPLGIAIGDETGIPSVLIENFTWDWLYEEYMEECKGLAGHVQYLKAIYQKARVHIQAEPFCCPGAPDLISPPVSRKTRKSTHSVREALGIPAGSKMAMITLGGIPGTYAFLDQLAQQKDVFFVIPGVVRRTVREKNMVLLPHQSEYYHPDLVNASDVVIGKVGYSTLAEVYRAGVPFGYTWRKGFRESPVLISFIEERICGQPIDAEDFAAGNWIHTLQRLLTMPRTRPQTPNGAMRIARFIMELLRGDIMI